MPNFNHTTWQDLFLSEPGKHINALATVENGGASSRHYQVIGAARFPGGDNRIYFDVFDLAGQRITPIYIDWNWENSGQTPAPGVGDKLPSEPSGGIDQVNAKIWLEVQGDPSERITIPPPDGSSWYVVFQLVDISEPAPQPEPEPNPLPGQPPATPFNLQIASFTDTTITLRWAMPSADPSTWAERFRVLWSKDMATWQHLISQSMRATVPDLSPDTLYLFRVQAVNQYGESPPAEIPGRTAKAPDEPPSPEPPATKTAGKWRVSMPPKEILVIPLRGNMVDQEDLHTNETPYVLIEFSRAELERILADMRTRGDGFVSLGITLVPRGEYENG